MLDDVHMNADRTGYRKVVPLDEIHHPNEKISCWELMRSTSLSSQTVNLKSSRGTEESM